MQYYVLTHLLESLRNSVFAMRSRHHQPVKSISVLLGLSFRSVIGVYPARLLLQLTGSIQFQRLHLRAYCDSVRKAHVPLRVLTLY